MDLTWLIDNRTIPLEVTAALQEIADNHHYSADMMHQHKMEIINELCSTGKGFIAKFLFPNGVSGSHDRWFHSLIRMEVRRLQKL